MEKEKIAEYERIDKLRKEGMWPMSAEELCERLRKEPSPPCQDCDLPDHECQCMKPIETVDVKKVFGEIFGEKK